jgi:hypothetical protein
MASVGLLRLVEGREVGAQLGFVDSGHFHAWIHCECSVDLVKIVADDAAAAAGPQPWRLDYEKPEKRGVKVVMDLKPPPARFSEFVATAIEEWTNGRPERAEYAAAYGTELALDGKKNTKPTALHFTAANQQFLATVEEIRSAITEQWIRESLYNGPERLKRGQNLRWDPDAERNRALMGVNPTADGTGVNAPLEWLAFRALPLFPCVPIGSRIVTCGVTGGRQEEFRFHWPLWSCGASLATVRSLLTITAGWIEDVDALGRTNVRSPIDTGFGSRASRTRQEIERRVEGRRARGVFALASSAIRRTAQGFGNFGPAEVRL